LSTLKWDIYIFPSWRNQQSVQSWYKRNPEEGTASFSGL
jgi:hypothetical protein